MKKFFRYRWVDVLVFPPVVVVLCRYVYGSIFFSSWGHFWMRILPWLLYAVTVSELCKWWGNKTNRRFRQLKEWKERLIYSISGYIFFHVAAILLMAVILKSIPSADLYPPEDKLIVVVIANFLTMILFPVLYECTTYFYKWKKAVTETEQLEQLNIESQYRSLQSQLNPHFLFNSFNVLSSLIPEHPRRAEDFVDELSSVYRYLLRSNEKEFVSIEEELRFIRSFFHLLQTRHGAGVGLKIEVSSEFFQHKVPALVLQVLVENAVKHNEAGSKKPLLIEIFEKNGKQLIVKNNLQPKKTRVASNQIGLENLRRRYGLLGVPGFSVHNDGRYFAVSVPFWE